MSTIKSYSAALRFPLSLVLDKDILDCPEYSQFMKGLIKLFPISRPIPVQWNLEVVLNFLRSMEPLRDLSPAKLMQKCLFLTAVACGRRVSELCHFGWNSTYLRIQKHGAHLDYTPGFLAKNESHGRLHPRVYIEAIDPGILKVNSSERYVCPVRALTYWRNFIRDTNPNTEQLFQDPSGKLQSPGQLSKHLVALIKEAHAACTDDEARCVRARGHDVRAVAASKLWLKCQSWDIIASAFTWKQSSVFTNHYERGMKACQSF